MTTVNQKEYLKKYLAIGKSHGTKKKRKKTEKALGKRLKIIDDDVDIELSEEIKHDLAEASEEAPQIVEVIDDRPPSLRYDEKTKSKLWVPMVTAEDAFMDERSSELNIKREPSEDISPPRINSDYSPKRTKQNRKREPSADISPPRINSDYSPKRTKQNRKREPSADISPPRINSDYSPKRRKQTIKRESSADISPVRIKTECSPNRTELLPPLRGHSADHSPERRRNNIIGDQSPRRRRKFDANKSQKLRNKNDSDNSPVRSRNVDSEDQSPKRLRNGDFRDDSPKRQKQCDTDYSPERRRNGSSGYQSPERRNQSQSHKEQSRKSSSRQKTSRWGENSPKYSNSTIEEKERPVCSKKSGLQNAQELNRELDSLREQEREMFAKTATELTGKNAATVCRKKKTTTPEEDLEQQRKQRELEEKYSRWGRGLKQVEDSSEKWADQLHEMSKPLARYADDEDLEKYLKEQEREGDPMLMYMRKKKKQKAVEAGIPDKPVYMGDFMPNRYGIRPGYRWDGVDRSNGYEQKLFQTKNSEKAAREEALMWNTEDM